MESTGVLAQVLAVETAAWAAASLVKDPELVPAEAADELYRTFDRIGRAAGAAKLLLAKRVAASGAHATAGHANVAEHLAAVSGTSLGAARSTLEASERLGSCGGTRDALLTGAVSPEQGAIIADAAAANPGAERDLIRSAKRLNQKELRQAALRAKAAADRDREATEARIRKDRRLSRSTDGEGAAVFFGKGPVIDAALIERELDAIIEELFTKRTATDPLEARSAYGWDAWSVMAANSRAHRLGITAGEPVTTPTTSPDAGDDPPRQPKAKRPAPKWLGLLHLDVAALRRGWLEDGERCEIPGVGPVSLTTARDLLGDAVLKLVISNGIDVQNVTSLTRRPTQAMQYAALWTNPTCIVEGCSRTRIEFDHVWGKEWAKTHQTRLPDLEGKCHHHHHLHTRFGWELAIGNGKRPLVPPDHPDHPRQHQPRGAGPPPPTGQSPPATRPPPTARTGDPDPPPEPGQAALVGDAA